MTRKCCRIWPNGEFSIWEERKSAKVEPPPESPDYLGLSLLANSHKIALGMADPPKERAKRGAKGITRLGARTVRNAAFLLEKKYGKDVLGFYTFTLPRVNATAEYRVGLEWAEIQRQFLQAVKRLLSAAGLPGGYVGCTEIQMGRYEKYGGMPLHLHLVLVGRKPGKGWAIHSDQWRSLWRRAVCNRVPELEGASWAASVDTVRVKKSAEGYLGKYMSKGVADVGPMLADDPGLSEFLPSSWWCCSTKLKRAVGRRIVGGYRSAQNISRDIFKGDTRIEFSRLIEVELEMGRKIPVAIIGKLSPEGRNRYCFKDSGVFAVAS